MGRGVYWNCFDEREGGIVLPKFFYRKIIDEDVEGLYEERYF